MPAPWKAVLFDAGNTLLFLDHARMAAAVGAALGVPLSAARLAGAADAAARAAERAAGPDRDRARAYLEALFTAAGVPADRMREVARLPAAAARGSHLWCRVAPDTREALDRLRAAGIRLGVVSNSDGRVEEALVAAGLRDYFDVVLDSALVGVEKPDPAIFRAALAALGVPPDEALYVGRPVRGGCGRRPGRGDGGGAVAAPGHAAATRLSNLHLARRAGRRPAERRTPLTMPGSRRSLPRPIRVLVAKPGLDGHDRGAKVVAAALRDAGMEVVYTGLHQTPEMIATAAVQEDVDVVGLSILSGAHMTLFPRVRQLMVDSGRPDILVTGGGIIPAEDMAALQEQGIGRLFGPGTPTSDLIEYIESWAAEHLEQ